MIDTACILFSALMCLFIAFRAIQLDKAMSWFASALPALRAAGAAMLPDRAAPPAAPGGSWRDRAQGAAPPGRATRQGWRNRAATPARRGRNAS